MQKMKIALIQMVSYRGEKAKNYETAAKFIRDAAERGADLAILPEMWTSTCTRYCLKEQEEVGGETYTLLQDLAKETGMYIVGGTIPIKTDDSNVCTNSCFVFGRDGKELGRYDKAHLFDCDIEGLVRNVESEYIKPGNQQLIIDTEFGKIAFAVCYDIRFPSYFIKMAHDGARLAIIPAAFSYQTGSRQWNILTEARASDGQMFVAAVSSARDENARYITYGHSRVVGPWGDLYGELDEKEGMLIQEIDFDEVDNARKMLPAQEHQRPELYKYW